jgi:hypothetical protein
MSQVRGGVVRQGLAALLLLAFAGAAQAQYTQMPTGPSDEGLERSMDTIFGLGRGAFIVIVVAGVAVLASVAIGFYVKRSATTDPRKIALSDPWIRAHMRQLEAEGKDVPSFDPPAEERPAE